MTADADLYALAERLYPLKRTVMNEAALETFDILGEWVGPLTPWPKRTDVPVGTKVFDWEVLPDAENRRAYHPSLEESPPYYGPLSYIDCAIPGRESKEVLLSTYTCHPSLANDNVSGMVVTAALAKWLASSPRRYTYRCLFAPETIGALCWLNANADRTPAHTYVSSRVAADVPGRVYFATLQRQLIAGYTINCCGDERAWSLIPSRKGDTLADRAAWHVLPYVAGQTRSPLTEYTFAERGSDERQFCAPGVDLPVASVMRSKHGTFPEYHTPADDLSIISAKGLGDSFRCYQRIIETIEANRTYRTTVIGEPRLDKYGLYPTSSGPDERARIARDLCAFSDGTMDLLAIAEATSRPMWNVVPVAEKLVEAGLLREC